MGYVIYGSHTEPFTCDECDSLRAGNANVSQKYLHTVDTKCCEVHRADSLYSTVDSAIKWQIPRLGLETSLGICHLSLETKGFGSCRAMLLLFASRSAVLYDTVLEYSVLYS